MRPLLITSGATHNPIDSMRAITANATGKTGNWIANQLSSFTDVYLFGSPLAVANAEPSLNTTLFGSTRDLESKVKEWLTTHPEGIVIHSAAVGDYEVANVDTKRKISSGQTKLSITLTPAPKILPQIKNWSSDVSIVSFKAAPPGTNIKKLIEIADNQRKKTASNMVFANVIGGTDRNIVIVEKDEHTVYATRIEALNRLVTSVKNWI